MIKEYENCKFINEEAKWTQYHSDSNTYKTDMKVLRDDSFHFIDGDTLYLEHLAKSYFKYVDNKDKLLEFRYIEIVKYFNNAIKKDYIYKFLKKYTAFKKDYLTLDNPKIQETIELIDEAIFEYSKNHPRFDNRGVMGALDSVRAVQKKRTINTKKIQKKKKCTNILDKEEDGIDYFKTV